MIKNEALNIVYWHLLQRNLGEAIAAMDNFLAVHPHQINADRLFAIRTDYQLMADYWRRGFKDPQLGHLYNNLLKRMYVLYANIASNYTMRHTPFLASLFSRAHMTPRDWSPLVVREELESFVSETAMLSLEPPHVAEPKRRDLYARHHRSMVELFDYILTSGLWTESFAAAMEETLLSPTIDTNDQQLLISSIMLSAMSYFDIEKFRLLVHVYQQTLDEYVRQRALTGWALSLDASLGKSIYPEEAELVEKLLEDEHCCRELVELQKQLIYCKNAEQDHVTIQNEIMPDLMKGQGFRITRNGIEEQEEDPLRDILHPDEAEESVEKVEASFQRMIDMQKQGADIYFGGFSQMKRFPFFNELANWFMPFNINHPEVQTAAGKFRDNRFLNGMMKSGPFCNSDKYSFLLAFEQVIGQLPQQVRQMLDRGEAAFQEMPNEDIRKPAYIRRIYLQDLYRFFRIFPQRDAFRNIFDIYQEGYLFFAAPLFSSTHLEPYFNEMTAFLIQKKRLEEAGCMIGNYGEHRRDYRYYMMAAYLAEDPHRKLELYRQAQEENPDSEKAVEGIARSAFECARYEDALKAYDYLLEQHSDKKSYLLNRAVCLTNLSRYDEAEKVLFRLNYESPDDVNVNRVLAWTLTCDGKYEQAEKLYAQLLTVEAPLEEDLLNYGYCLWFSGSIDDAADCFHRFLMESGESKEYIIANEKKLILAKGITEPEIQMMLYIL